jgi:hypothetical protein
MAIVKYMLVLVLVIVLPQSAFSRAKGAQDIAKRAIEKHYREVPEASFYNSFWKDVMDAENDINATKTVTIEENIATQQKEAEEYVAKPMPEKPEEPEGEVAEGVWHMPDDKSTTEEPVRFVLYQDAKRALMPGEVLMDDKQKAEAGATCPDENLSSLIKKVALLEREKEALREVINRLASGQDIGE